MMAAKRTQPLIDILPEVRGRYNQNVPLSDVTWFRVGGCAEIVFRPADIDDLATFLRQRPPGIDVTVLGVGSNLLVRDGGIPGVVIRLGRGFAAVEILENDVVKAGAGALDGNVALTCRDAGLTGLEFLSGIPGTIGGALRMNAGAYGTEMTDILVEAEAVDMSGTVHRLKRDDMGFSYRHCDIAEDLANDWIFTAAAMQAAPGEASEIFARMAEISEQRDDSQPVRQRTGGSTFKNPNGPTGEPKAWQLIDEAGCRGLRRGGALISEKHCNFMINEGNATAADLESLGEEVRRRVAEHSGVVLEWEIRRVGVNDAPPVSSCHEGDSA